MLHIKITTINKGTTFYTSNFQPGKLIHTDFSFYNVTSIYGFTSILTLVCAKTRMLWVSPNASKISPVRIILLILTTLKHGQHPCKGIIVDKDAALENSIDVTKLFIEGLKLSMETTSGDASWINVKN